MRPWSCLVCAVLVSCAPPAVKSEPEESCPPGQVGESVAPAPAERGLVAHEWGTFTSVAGADGVQLHWRPLGGPSELPEFVYRPDRPGPGQQPGGKGLLGGTVRMETPVIYFYAGRATEVRLSVRFERGGLTEWFPHAQEVDHGHIDWGRFTVEPASASNLARMPEASARGHYFAARDTDAAVVRVPTPAGEQHEKFLFYRGVGVFDLPLVVGLAGADVSLRRRTDAGPRTALVVERRGAQLGLAEVALADGAVTVPRPALDDDVAAARAWLAAALERDGLYPREARAMLATWEDQWFEDGLRVFYLLPRPDIDELLPLAIEPTPVELRRTIVARAELVTPELEAAVRAEALAPGRDVEAVCRALRARHGRFAEAVLQRLRADADARTAARLDAVLARVAEPRPCPEV